MPAAVLATVLTPAAAAQADPVQDAFLAALSNAGVSGVDPATAVALGQQVCPQLAGPGQTAADVAARVAEAGGMSLGPATAFTGIAITMFCPAAVASIGAGNLPQIPGFGF